jgi:hypothetical protein
LKYLPNDDLYNNANSATVARYNVYTLAIDWTAHTGTFTEALAQITAWDVALENGKKYYIASGAANFNVYTVTIDASHKATFAEELNLTTSWDVELDANKTYYVEYAL